MFWFRLGALRQFRLNAVECSPACPNGCNADGSCKVVNVVAQVEEETPDEEEIGWSTLDKKTQETIAKNQARNAAAGQSDEARAIYDAQQQRYDQRDASKEKYADTLNAGDERIRNMEALTEQASRVCWRLRTLEKRQHAGRNEGGQ